MLETSRWNLVIVSGSQASPLLGNVNFAGKIC